MYHPSEFPAHKNLTKQTVYKYEAVDFQPAPGMIQQQVNSLIPDVYQIDTEVIWVIECNSLIIHSVNFTPPILFRGSANGCQQTVFMPSVTEILTAPPGYAVDR